MRRSLPRHERATAARTARLTARGFEQKRTKDALQDHRITYNHAPRDFLTSFSSVAFC